MRVKDLYSSIFVFFSGLLCIFWVIPRWSPKGDGIGAPPAALPYTLVGLIVALSFLLFVRTLLSGKIEYRVSLPKWVDVKNFVLIASLLVLAAPAFAHIGFIVTGIVFLAIFQFFLGQRNLLLLGAISIGLPYLLYAALWYGMRIMLP
jgi:hypothetical protein